MLSELKNAEKQIKNKLNKGKTNLNENSVIEMVVKNDDNFLSTFSNSITPVISEEVATFLENRVENIHSKNKINLKICSDCIDNEEQKLYDVAVKEYYQEKYISSKSEIKKYNLISLILVFFGLLVLSTSIFIEYYFNRLLWAEAIDIVAWVLLWEATDIFIFKIASLRRKTKKYLMLYFMNIEYYNLNNSQQ